MSAFDEWSVERGFVSRVTRNLYLSAVYCCQHFLGAECCRPCVRVHQLLKGVLPNLCCLIVMSVAA